MNRCLPRLLRAALLAAVCAAAAQPALAQAPVSATGGSPAAIARIRAEFTAIEREAPSYRRTAHDLWGFSLEGGELQGFYRGSELRKLAAHLYGESWRGTQEYYFSGGRLVFVYFVTEVYDQPMSGTVRARVEHRLYFDGGRLIRQVRSQHPAGAGDLTGYDADLPSVLRDARLFAACAAAAGAEPPECTAPER
jgi:hypothetical protein